MFSGNLMALGKFALATMAVVLTAGTVVVTTGMIDMSDHFGSGRDDSRSHAKNKPTSAQIPLEKIGDDEEQQLYWLHASTVMTFIEKPGFGASRMMFTFDLDVIDPPTSKDRLEGTNSGRQGPPLLGHKANPKKSKQPDISKVIGASGFDHILTQDEKEIWKVRSVQLVGLVTHQQPVAYITDNVPNMKKVKEVPTRELDAFETAALAAFRAGKNLEIERHGNEIRMVGPIVAGAACVKCHEVKGQLLGAFTYWLDRKPIPVMDDE